MVLPRISKKFYFLCNHRNEFKQLINRVWNLYLNKRMFSQALDDCRIGIFTDLKRSLKMFKSRQYLVTCLEIELLSSFELLHPVCAFSQLVNCNRKVRSVNKCGLCTRFYVYVKSTMTLFKSKTMLSNFLTAGDNINNIFQDVKRSIVYSNNF